MRRGDRPFFLPGEATRRHWGNGETRGDSRESKDEEVGGGFVMGVVSSVSSVVVVVVFDSFGEAISDAVVEDKDMIVSAMINGAHKKGCQ